MMSPTPRSGRRLAALSLFALLLSGTACMISVDAGQFTVREEKQFTVTGTPEVTLITFDGSMEIRSWDRPTVQVEIEKRAPDKASADAMEVRAEQSGNVIRLEVKKPPTIDGSRLGFNTSRSARIIATVPKACNLVARTGDGSISVERLDGRMDLDTGDGSIQGYGLSGSLRAHTGDGSMKLEHVDGTLDLDSGDGSASVSGQVAALKLHTGDGSVVVRIEDGSAMTGDWEVRTGDGSVRLELPDAFDASLDASTGDGRVRLEGLEQPTGDAGDESAHRSLRQQLGSGGKLLRVRSGSGSNHRSSACRFGTRVRRRSFRRAAAPEGRAATVNTRQSLGRGRRRLPRRVVRVLGRIVDSCRREAVPPFAALAAQPAVAAAGRVHARERQLERHAEPRPQANHVFLVQPGEGRLDADLVGEAQRQRARHRGRRTAASRRERGFRPADRGRAGRSPRRAQSTPRLRQQQAFAAGQVDVLVRRVVRRGRAAERPVTLGVHVAHRHRRALPAARHRPRAAATRGAAGPGPVPPPPTRARR